MRIAFVSTMNGPSWGGSEELWSQAALCLKKKGHEVFASVISWIRDSDKVVRLANSGIQVETHSPFLSRARSTWQNLQYGGPKYYHRLKAFNPDLIIISQGHNSGGFEWAKVAREISKPYALIVHCNGDQWWFGEHLVAAVESYTAAQTVFCVAQKNLDLLRFQLGGEPLQNAELVWNPFNVSPQKVPTWPADSGEWRMACPARLFPQAKGQDLLLRTLAMQQWRDRPVVVNLYGSGPDEAALRRIAEKQHINSVRFCGHVSDIQKIWEQNHLLLLPSRYEGLPIVLVDAMWCARPAVVTDVGDNARMCVDGETGFVASAPTLASFSDALERAWEKRDEWRQLGLAARRRAEDMIPVDPIPVFCDRLEACVTKSLQNC